MKTVKETQAISSKSARSHAGAIMVPLDLKNKKPTKHGQEINRLLQKLSQYEWDFEAMKRA